MVELKSLRNGMRTRTGWNLDLPRPPAGEHPGALLFRAVESGCLISPAGHIPLRAKLDGNEALLLWMTLADVQTKVFWHAVRACGAGIGTHEGICPPGQMCTCTSISRHDFFVGK